MKTKAIQKVLWLTALAAGLLACKKNNAHKAIDSYPIITEGRVFLPILTHKPEMEKIKKAEKSRKGDFENVSEVASNEIYEFSYTDMDVKKSFYIINKTSGILVGVYLVFEKNDIVSNKIENLAKKNGFGDESLLSKALGGALLREKEELFVILKETLGLDTKFIFNQFSKQPGPMPTIENLGERWVGMIMEAKIKEIQELEKQLEGTLSKTKKLGIGMNANEIIQAEYKPHKDDITTLRTYYFSWDNFTPPAENGLLSNTVFSYDKPQLGSYKDDIQGNYMPTKEFLSLIEKENYTFEKKGSSLNAFPFNIKNKIKNRKIKVAIETTGATTFLNLEMSLLSSIISKDTAEKR